MIPNMQIHLEGIVSRAVEIGVVLAETILAIVFLVGLWFGVICAVKMVWGM